MSVEIYSTRWEEMRYRAGLSYAANRGRALAGQIKANCEFTLSGEGQQGQGERE